jgi:methionyl aminopeptidase
MIYYKTQEEIEIIAENCMLVSKTLAYVGSLLRPGVTGLYIDTKAEEFIRDNGAIPGFLNLYGFPNTLCISPNECVVHGIPSKKEFGEKDIVSIDCGVYNNEYFGDAAFTFAFPEVKEETMDLLYATNKSLYLGIEQAVAGNRIGDVSYAIQHYCEKVKPFGIVRELVGHGLGKNLHEAPEVPNFGSRGRGTKIQEGLVIAIEPMVNGGRRAVKQSNDGWTIVTKDNSPSAHFEHTIAVTESGARILSDHSIIEEALKNNEEIKNFSIKS